MEGFETAPAMTGHGGEETVTYDNGGCRKR